MKTLTRPAAALALATALSAQAQAIWLPTWTAAPQSTWRDEFPFPTGLPESLQDATLRQVARVSLGGARLRLVLSNAHGNSPLALGAVHVALAADDLADGGRILPGSDRSVSFGGAAAARLAADAPLVSDPVDLPVPALSRLVVSIHLPGPAAPSGFHWDGRDTAWLAAGDLTAAPSLPGATTTGARAFLAGVLVEAPAQAGVVAAIGDSITDGNGATPDRDRRWPDVLADRLAGRGVAVVNAGISGNRLLSDGMGASVLARLDRDVLAQPGLRAAIVLAGSNDIAWPGTPFAPHERQPTLDELAAGYRQLAARAHARGVRVLAGTLPPFEGALAGTPLASYASPAKDALRRAVNDWLRGPGAGVFDGIVDFDATLRDPAHPARLAPAFDSGDHLHPGDVGNAAMAGTIALDLLLGRSDGR